jgi:outer membrane protein
MKNQILALVAIVGVVASFAFNWLHRAPKIGYAETSVLLTQFSEAGKAKLKFEEAQKEWDSNLKALNDSLTASLENLKKGFDKANADEKNAMKAKVQRGNEDLQRYSNAVRQLSQEKEKELMDPVVRKVNTYMDVWGKEHGFALILGTTTAGNILRADPEMNVTSEFLRDLNEHYKDMPVGRAVSDTSNPLGAEKSGK